MLGKPAPDSSLGSTGGNTFRLSEQRGQRLVPHFYPQHDSPLCTSGGDKNTHGKKVRGIASAAPPSSMRTRKLVRAWRGVKVPGHAEEVLSFVKAL